MNTKTLFASLMLSLSFAGTAQATLLEGQQVKFTYYFPDTSQAYEYADNGPVTVGDGVEVANAPSFLGLFPIAQLDISDTNLLITFSAFPEEYAPFFPPPNVLPFAPFNGFVISDALGLIDAFTSVTINSHSNMDGFNAGHILVEDDDIWVNWQGLSYIPGTTVLSLDINADSQAIPEPGTIALLGLGLLLTTFARRRKF